MKVFRSLDEIRGQIVRPVVTVGSYDGVHAGHREILRQMKLLACENKGETLVVTFDPHPRQVLPNCPPVSLLTPTREKMTLLEEAGLDNLLILKFTPEFSRLSSAEFVEKYLFDGIGIHTLVMGYNHHFGRDREGDRNFLDMLREQYNFRLFQLPRYDTEDGKVSSTVIRRLLANGDVKTARQHLMKPYMVMGSIVNNGELIPGERAKLLPGPGKYAVKVGCDEKELRAVLSIRSDAKMYLETSFGKFPEKENVKVKFLEKLRY